MKRWIASPIKLLMAVVISATCTAPVRADDPSVDGQWSNIFSWGMAGGIEPIHMVMLPNGKVLFWQYSASSMGLWDPATQLFSASDLTIHNPFCAGFAFLADGRLLLAGGHVTDQNGASQANIYNPFTNTWADNVPNMPPVQPGAPYGANASGRWYPSATTLGNGDVLFMSGSLNGNFNPDENPMPQVYQAEFNTWRNLTTAYNQLPLYPRAFLAPDGRVISIGDYGGATEYLDTSGTGSWSYVANALTTDGQNNLWYYAPAVMYDKGKILLVGGDDSPAPTDNAQILDLNVANPSWRYAGGGTADPPEDSPYTMAQPRRQHNATLLADGKVFISGGSSLSGFNNPLGQIAAAEIWDPETELFEQVAAASSTYRGYHTTALLLPDATVLVAGGNHDLPVVGYTENRNGEIYSPPYLFNSDGSPATRPTITTAPATAVLGRSFFVETPDAAAIAEVTFIVPVVFTHSQDWTQRINFLDFTTVDGGLAVTLPSNPNEAPPGYYMLFLINSEGVPSVAKFVRALPPVAGIPGDINHDDAVDAADYVVWRTGWGSTYSPAEYVDWLEHFGEPGASSSADAPVPEPRTIWILAIGAVSLIHRPNSRRQRYRGISCISRSPSASNRRSNAAAGNSASPA